MARETLEQRQARVERDRAHEERNRGAIQAEEAAISALRERRGETLRIGKPVPSSNKRAAGPAENKAASPTVDFASAEAEELAKELGVKPADLADMQPSGVRGYTVADVRTAAERRDE